MNKCRDIELRNFAPERGKNLGDLHELSIFIDESGDFGELKERPAYYLVTMVFQKKSF